MSKRALHLTDEEYAQILGRKTAKPKGENKYHAKITVVDNIKFRSKLEAKRWAELRFMERAGLIHDLKHHTRYPFFIDSVYIAFYESDFEYVEKKTGDKIVEDTKGYATDVYKIKRRLMQAIYGIEVKEIRK